MNKSRFSWFILTVLLLAIFCLTTCDSPLGMGLPIDWEPPVLTLDPIPNPLVVRQGTTITGKVTDNVGVDRVIFINADTKEELFPVQRSGNNFKIDLLFTEKDNGKKIVSEIWAYDKMGNTGGTATVTITLKIDIRPPIVQYLEIKRTDSKIASIEPYAVLKELETTDPNGDKKADLLKYQNGWFYINGIISEKETKITDVSLIIYDIRDMDDPLITYKMNQMETGATVGFPSWIIKEEDIINAGVTKFGADYKTNYYKVDPCDDSIRGERYYYYIVVRAKDESENESGEEFETDKDIEEDEGFFCMWANSDTPKGLIDPSIGTIVSRGTPLPVFIFDDDSLQWAYSGLLTKDQWDGKKNITSSVKIDGNKTDAEKLIFLKGLLTGNSNASIESSAPAGAFQSIYNWRYDRYNDTSADATISQLIGTTSTDNLIYYVPTGKAEADYGDYVLFTLVADSKLSPHTKGGPEFTNKNIWSGKVQRVQVIDENAPLIVFDKTAGCPEENTFPDPLIAIDTSEEKYFNIVGYTLRENASGKNKVDVFRMAWIPYNKAGGADDYITAVQYALSGIAADGKTNVGYPASFNANTDLEGVQHWDFVPLEKGVLPPSGKAPLYNEGQDEMDGGVYIQQSFSKRFSVMGDQDDVNASYYNFKYDYKKADGTPGKDGILDLENETKLFVLYALDNMGHEVFRQLRLLGFKSLPEISVYDITNNISNDTMPNGYPNPSDNDNVDPSAGKPTDLYYKCLKDYNDNPDVISKLKSTTAVSEDLSIPFMLYPRDTILKYIVKSEKAGKVGIESIIMKDITFTTQKQVGSAYNLTDKTLTFCEYYPDVTQRTFLFEATDKLGNTAQIQRTIAVTNAARLENITTTSQSGLYGIDKVITLRANFSSQIYINNDIGPLLNIHYKNSAGTDIYEALPCKNLPTKASPSLYLEFDFKVPVNSAGILETVHGGMSGLVKPFPIDQNGSEIFDYSRGDSAFIPGYKNESVFMPNWTSSKNSLQEKKSIELDGVRPVIKTAVWGGKTAHSSGGLYFKEGDSITLTVTADKEIRASGTSTIQYSIADSNTTVRGPYTTEFKYQKPGADKQTLIYSLPVNSASCPYNGRLTNVIIYTSGGGNIVDNADNTADSTAITMPSSTFIYIKQSKPAAPAATLNGTAFASAADTYNTTPTMVIPDSTSTFTGGGVNNLAWEDTKEYSLNGGSTWITYNSSITIPVGTHNLQARYIDRAGNTGDVRSKSIQVNDTFPKLISASVKQSNGWYKAGEDLEFNLNFADKVRVQTLANVTIKIGNRAAGTPTDNSTSAITLTTSTAASTNTYTTTIKFNWNNITNKEMRDGLYIYAVDMSGLRDEFGNSGRSGTGVWNGVITISSTPNYTCPNLPWTSSNASVKVDAILPVVNSRTPAVTPVSGTNTSITELTITFSEPVMKGSGIITIRPRGTYAIPPVLEDEGYYLGTDGNRYNSASADRTYISSFYDIYNALPAASPATLRGYLLEGTSMSNHTLNSRTGQSKGPYKKMTQGLISGYGYTGDYTGTNVSSGQHAPSLGGPKNSYAYTALIPDTATKWVLDYKYGITQNVTAVNNIRTALTNAKWRWQEIDVVNTSIGNTPTTNHIVTITLNEPLLKGLDWDVYYPEGAFTDLAGNPATGSGTTPTDPTQWSGSTFYFTTPGVQPPVIRVNRRSYDGRTANWENQGTYNSPQNTSNNDNINSETAWINTTEVTDDNGWGIRDFRTVHFRVETESPGVVPTAQYFRGDAGNKGGITAAWSGTIGTSTWTTTTQTVGTWVTTNLIRRAGAGQTYTVTTKNSTTEARTSQDNLRMFKSYNKDLTGSDLGYPTGTAGVTLTSAPLSANAATLRQGVITFDSLQASKSYIVGSATFNGVTAKGVEGVFRTVIMINQDTGKGSTYLAVEGSNIKNGMPSVAGFPVRDAEESGDCRFIKLFYNQTDQSQFYWVSTEIVCEWYFLSWANGSGGTHQRTGEVNNYFMIGYGDLTYGYNIQWY